MSDPVPIETLTRAEVLRTAASVLVERLQLGRAMGLTFDGKRNLGEAFGYKSELGPADYRLRYERGGIAGRIVDAFPKATWRGGVELIEDEDAKHDTEFEQAWRSLEARLHITVKLEAVDILSRLSTFAVLLIGDGEDLSTELAKNKGPEGLIFLTPYLGAGGPNQLGARANQGGALSSFAESGVSVADARVADYDKDPQSPRYGLPSGYQLRRMNFGDANFADKIVHWSRVVHIAEGCLDDQVYGQPALRRVWNLLDDLDKVVGGGAEAFFQRVNQGRLWNIDKEVKGLTPAEKEDFRTQIEAWEHGITRNVRARGIDVTDLGSDTSNFLSPADAIETLIAGSVGIPKRILTGSEMGELASSQDRDNWRDQVNGRRMQYAEPDVLRRTVDRFIEYGFLPKPTQYKARWGAVMNMTEDEKQTKAKSWAETKTDEGQVFLNDEIRDLCYEMAPLTPEQKQAMAEAKAAATPPVAPGFPRAAQDIDDSLVERLAQAIEQNDTAVIDEIIGVVHADA